MKFEAELDPLDTLLNTSCDSVSFFILQKHHADDVVTNTSNKAGNRQLDIGIVEGVLSLVCCPSCMQNALHYKTWESADLLRNIYWWGIYAKGHIP